jgi:hypothetical protein
MTTDAQRARNREAQRKWRAKNPGKNAENVSKSRRKKRDQKERDRDFVALVAAAEQVDWKNALSNKSDYVRKLVELARERGISVSLLLNHPEVLRGFEILKIARGIREKPRKRGT